MKRKRTAILSIFLILSLGLAITSAGAEVKFIQISSGPVGGAYYILGGALADLLKDKIPGAKVTVTTGGSLANISKTQSGKADIGFTMNRLVYEARNNTGAYEGKGTHDNVLGVTYLCDIYMALFLVSEDFPISSISDIKAKKLKIRILTSPRASSPSVAAERLLEGYGVSFEDIESWGGKVNFVSYSEAGSLLKDGHADVWFGPMVPPILEWTVSKKVKFLGPDKAILENIKEKYQYGIATIPTNHWEFIKKPTPIMTESIMIVIRKQIPEDMVYEITKAINTNPDVVRKVHRLFKIYDPKNACNITGTAMHPGALKYYKEIGLPCK
jgi:TRAP transporter TAXI family solute receptor